MTGQRQAKPKSYPISRAEKIAAGLIRSCGAQALDRARQRGRRAEAAGHHGQVDLYTAVCTILADRGGVFSRSRAAPSLPVLPAGLHPVSDTGIARPLPLIASYTFGPVTKAA